jgi:predicted neuraminidase
VFWRAVFFACSLVTAVLAASGSTLVPQEFVFESAPFPSCHAATIAEVDGGLVCAYFGGTAERNPDVGIWVSRKEKGSDHWTPPVEVANGVQSAELRYPAWNPVLFQPRSGDLMLFYKVGPVPSQWWGMVTTSADGGKSWTTPRKLGDRLIGPVKDKPIQLDDGTILAGSSTEDGGWKVHVERSTDDGKTWESIAVDDPEKLSCIQPTLLTLPGGRIQMLCRSNKSNKICESHSDDGGKSWSPLAATTLPNNNSGIDAVTLADGRHLLVYNHTTADQADGGHKGRGILNVATTRDGQQWDAALVLERTSENKQYSYPSVIQTKDGLVHIVYTWDRKRIKHVVLDPTKLETKPIIAGKWPDEIY